MVTIDKDGRDSYRSTDDSTRQSRSRDDDVAPNFMVHRICHSTRNETLAYVDHLWSNLLQPDVDMAQKLETLFAEESDELDLECGFLSRIDTDEATQYLQFVHGPHEALETGRTIPLSETYCRRTIADPSGTMAVSDALAEGWRGDPAYEAFDLGSYVGTTVTADDELYGTLCFANTAPRTDPIREEEVQLVEMFGRWASFELNQWTGPPTRDTVRSSVDDGALSPSRMDSTMDVLGERDRRLLLLALLENPVVDRVEFVERYVDAKNARAQLYHNHLPKLTEAGYVEWNPDTGELSRGPSFDDVEPLVRLLREYTQEFPD
jgi:hypothetical protein